MNSKEKGDISVAMIFAALVKSGYTVLTPWGDKEKYDLVVDDNSKFIRVQCKTGILKDGCIQFRTVSITTKNGKAVTVAYTKEDIDVFMIYCPQNEQIYLVPIEDKLSSICCLRLELPKNNQTKGVRFADKCLFEGNFGVFV